MCFCTPVGWSRSPLAHLHGLGVGFAAARDPDDLRRGAWQSVYESEAEAEPEAVIACCKASLGINAGLLFMDRETGRAVLRKALVGSKYANP